MDTGQYASWKSVVLADRFISAVQGIVNPYGVQCVNVDWHLANYLWPSVPLQQTITTGDARTLFQAASTRYFDKLKNNGGTRPDIQFKQGDIAVFGPTPAAGYANQYENPDGHTGVVDGWDSNGLTLLQQDGSAQSTPVSLKYRRFDYSPLIGVLRPKNVSKEVCMDEGTVHNLYLAGWKGRNPAGATPEELKRWVGRPMQEFFYEGGKNQYEWLWEQIRTRDKKIAELQASADPTMLKLAEAIKEIVKKS